MLKIRTGLCLRLESGGLESGLVVGWLLFWFIFSALDWG
jgi:hypothetical protein